MFLPVLLVYWPTKGGHFGTPSPLGGTVMGGGGSFISESREGAKEGVEYKNVGREKVQNTDKK